MIDISAFVSPSAIVNESAIVWQHCVVLEGAYIGPGCVLGHGGHVGKGVRLESNVITGAHVILPSAQIVVEDNVNIGGGVVFSNIKYPRSFGKRERLGCLVRRGVSIGINSSILPGIELGEYATIGAGSVVTKNVPAFTLVAGNPARRVGCVCYCGKPMLSSRDHRGVVYWKCEACEQVYTGEVPIPTARQ